MTTTELTSPLVIEREKKEKNALEKVTAWVVKTAEDYHALDAFLVGLADLKKMIVADFAESKEETAKAKKAATAAHKAVCDQEEGHIGIIEDARRIGKGKLADFEEAQRRETARLQAIEDEKAEIERKRVLALAKIAEKKGDDAKAEALRETSYTPAPRLASMVPERSTTVQTRWGATVGGVRMDGTQTDPLFVLHAIEAAGKVLAKSKTKDAQDAAELLRQAYTDMAFLKYDQVAINQIATATKGAVRYGGFAVTSRKV